MRPVVLLSSPDQRRIAVKLQQQSVQPTRIELKFEHLLELGLPQTAVVARLELQRIARIAQPAGPLSSPDLRQIAAKLL